MSALLLAFLCCVPVEAFQDKPSVSVKPPQPTPTRAIVYKNVDGVELKLQVFEPQGHKPTDKRGAIVFFFGGGWVNGTPKQFYPHCDHLAKQGIVAISAEYRIRSKHRTTPFECVKDGKSALRYVRSNAAKLGIDPSRIAAGGGSAGGHVAAAVATVPGLNEPSEDTTISCVPNALVLFNPVYDNGPKGYGHKRVKDRFKEISPLHNLSKKTPPAIVFLGTNDKLIPVSTAEKFRDTMKAAGVMSELVLFKDRTHGFFNASKGDGSDYRSTLKSMDEFLRKTRILPADSDSAVEIVPGTYGSELQTPGGPLRFSLDIKKTADGVWSAEIVDPLESIVIPQVTVEGTNVTFAFPHYDSSIKAKLEGEQLVGTYRRRRGKDRFAEMPFTARRGELLRSRVESFQPFVGRWSVNFSKSDDPAIGIFSIRKSDQQQWGTFLTTTGDYRFLTEQPCDKPGHVELSVFDGAHAFLFRMKKRGDDVIVGDFWSSDSWHEPFEAKRDATAKLPDAFLLTTVLKGVNLNQLRYPDLSGKLTSLGDSKFKGKAKLIQVFGSWCPNCHDAALYMSELQKKYGDRGLSIVGLAFEHTGEFERDVQMVKRYMKRHGTKYPVLLAGQSDKSVATKQFPLIDRVRSYPTTIFVRSDGSVRAVYTGFNGPATGEANKQLRARFESLIEELLR